MPFNEVNIKEIIDKEKQGNSGFAKLWDESRTEYKLPAELVKLRKEQKITQEELAKITGNTLEKEPADNWKNMKRTTKRTNVRIIS